MVDLQTLGVNFMLILGALLALGFGFLALFTVYTLVRAAFWHVRQRRSWNAYVKSLRRADGARFPPCGEGFCDDCGDYSRTIFYVAGGPDLCPGCYDRFWREREANSTVFPFLPPSSTPTENAASKPHRFTGKV
jgi:hypothetical protein